MSSLWQRPALDLLQATASPAPTPGGGSTAAVTAALGAALLEMALRITLKKNGEEGELGAVLDTLTRLRERFQAFADEDVRAFGGYVRATRLPEGPAREEALGTAGKTSLQVPLELARMVVGTLETASTLVPQVHPEVTSDVGAGASILEGALHAALLTVEINLPHVLEEERGALEAERDRLEVRGTELAAEVLRLTRERLRDWT